MTGTQAADEPAIDARRGNFRLKHVAEQNIERQAFILDQMAAQPAVRTLKAWALTELAPVAGETAVDVGSGTGEDVVAFAERVRPDGRAVGVEPSPGLRDEAVRRAAGAPVEYVDGRAERLPFDDESVDVLRCERVLQHVDNPAAAVREMARALRPGGRIALIDTDWATAILHPADPDVLRRMVDYFLSESASPVLRPATARSARGRGARDHGRDGRHHDRAAGRRTPGLRLDDAAVVGRGGRHHPRRGRCLRQGSRGGRRSRRVPPVTDDVRRQRGQTPCCLRNVTERAIDVGHAGPKACSSPG